MDLADVKKAESEMDEILQVASQMIQDSKSSPPSLTGTAAPTSEEDNMDYDSDEDDDDSKSNHSSSNPNNRKKRLKGDMQRSHHNVLERKRRDLIKESFSKLRDVVPTLTNERASRAQILKRAADFIQLTHQRNETTKADIKELVRKNMELENKMGAGSVKKEQVE